MPVSSSGAMLAATPRAQALKRLRTNQMALFEACYA
jgi:hypothetical protein